MPTIVCLAHIFFLTNYIAANNENQVAKFCWQKKEEKWKTIGGMQHRIGSGLQLVSICNHWTAAAAAAGNWNWLHLNHPVWSFHFTWFVKHPDNLETIWNQASELYEKFEAFNWLLFAITGLQQLQEIGIGCISAADNFESPTRPIIFFKAQIILNRPPAWLFSLKLTDSTSLRCNTPLTTCNAIHRVDDE